MIEKNKHKIKYSHVINTIQKTERRNKECKEAISQIFFLCVSECAVLRLFVLKWEGGGGEGRGREELPENWRSSVARKQGGGEAEEKQGGGWVKEEGVKGVRVFFSNFFLLFFILHLPEKNIS